MWSFFRTSVSWCFFLSVCSVVESFFYFSVCCLWFCKNKHKTSWSPSWMMRFFDTFVLFSLANKFEEIIRHNIAITGNSKPIFIQFSDLFVSTSLFLDGRGASMDAASNSPHVLQAKHISSYLLAMDFNLIAIRHLFLFFSWCVRHTLSWNSAKPFCQKSCFVTWSVKKETNSL